jgi:CRISPR system Cascade subunit CasB
MPLQFNKEPVRQVLHDWWVGLEDSKGDRASLRRCREPLEALFIPAYHRLYLELCNKLDKTNMPDRNRLPAVAALLSQVRSSVTERSFAGQMATPRQGGSEPRLSELRFRRLLQYQTREDLFPALRRVVRLLDGNVNLYSLANDLYWWGDRIKRNWAYEYYGQ